MSEVEMTVTVENAEEVKMLMNRFPFEFKNSLFMSFQRMANKEEKHLKATTGFKDRTGHLRRSLYAVATFNPVGLEIGAFASYAYWVAYGHGTWLGNWWNTYIGEMIPRVVEGFENGLNRLVEKFNRGE